MDKEIETKIRKVLPKKQADVFIRACKGNFSAEERKPTNPDYINLSKAKTKIKRFVEISEDIEVQNELNGRYHRQDK